MVFILLKVFCLERSMAKAFALTFKLMVGVANGNPKKHGFQIILAGSRNLESVFGKSCFAWFVFPFLESQNFLPRSLGLGFSTSISASWQVSDFTIATPNGIKSKKNMTGDVLCCTLWFKCSSFNLRSPGTKFCSWAGLHHRQYKGVNFIKDFDTSSCTSECL